jgi:hypothetical protein
MKLMSARSSLAPGPLSTVKRAPEIFVPRSKSMMPSAGPRSQCAWGSKSKRRGSPTVRTTGLSALLVPTGTDSCGRFGQHEQPLLALMLDRVELHAELLDLLRALPAALLDRSSIEPLSLGPGYLIA